MIEIALSAAPDDDVRLLIGELEADLSSKYPPEQRHGLALDAIYQPHVRFYVAREGGAPLGCGGVGLFDGFAEVKRMYVRPAARGQGVADAILARIEETARASGRTLLQLETGTEQIAACRFYERAGFRPCGPFGAYASMEPHRIRTSLFYEKRL